MTLEEFSQHAEAWGADIARWPDGLQDEARRIATSSSLARTILDKQRALDEWLDGAAPQIAQERIDRAIFAVVNTLADTKPRTRLLPRLQRWLIPAAGLACAVAIGGMAAIIGPLAETGTDDTPVLTQILDNSIFDQSWTTL